jgi:hypothetical protein
MFRLQLPSATIRQAVVLRALPAFGVLPGRFDPPASFQTVKRWVQRPGFNLKKVIRGALDVLGDRVPVRWPEEQRAEDQQVECALEKPESGSEAWHSVDILPNS